MWQTEHQHRQHNLLSMPPQQTRDKFLQHHQSHYQYQHHPQFMPLPQELELIDHSNQMFYPPQQQEQQLQQQQLQQQLQQQQQQHQQQQHQQQQHQQQQHQQQMQNVTAMDITAHSSSNPRASRNMAEKQRRDNLNTQIATMASLVPTVSTGGSRKKDKISVLRLSAAHLRIAYTLGQPSNEFLPRQFNDIDLENCLIDNLAGNSSFLIVVTTSGKIIYISRHIEQHLGHEQLDLVGDSWYNYVYREDHDELTRGLTPDENCLGAGPSNIIRTNGDSLEDTSNSSEDSGQTRVEYANFREQRRSFNIRMAQRTNSRRETVQYEYLQVSGMLRLASECRQQALTRTRREHHSTSNDIIFVGTARLLKKRTITELTLLEANKNEYFTRHLVDGRIIFCDHRISIIAGYMSDEVSGSSAFKFMHKDDVKWTIVALRQMYDQGNYGSSCYRLQTKTGQFIYLRTHGYLEYDESTQSVASFICINTLTSPEEGEELIIDMKKRFSATISSTVRTIHGSEEVLMQETSTVCSTNGPENVEELSNIDDAILHMISDLPTPVMAEDRQVVSPLPNAQLVKAAIYAQRLPPVAIQASRVGIKDIDNSWSHGGKGGKGGKSNRGDEGGKSMSDVDESSSSSPKPVVSRGGKHIAEKRIPELEECHSPVSPTKSLPIAEKVLSPSNSVETEIYAAPGKIEKRCKVSEVSTNNAVASIRSVPVSTSIDVQSNNPDCVELQMEPENLPYQMSLKRPYVATGAESLYTSPTKKKAVEDCVTLDAIEKSVPCVNGGLSNYPGFMQTQTVTLETNLQGEQTSYQQFDTSTLVLPNSGTPFIDFQNIQDDQLLNNAIENNSELLKIFSNLPPTIATEGLSDDANEHEYLTGEGTVDTSKLSHAHLQAGDSMSSCESQFSDADEANIQGQCQNEN